jgi:hypothetical protein
MLLCWSPGVDARAGVRSADQADNTHCTYRCTVVGAIVLPSI